MVNYEIHIYIYHFFKYLGKYSLELFWFPLVIWSIVAIIALLILRSLKTLDPLYKYHFRVAIVFAIPFGFTIKYIFNIIKNITLSNTSMDTSLFAFANPLEVVFTSKPVLINYSLSYLESNFLLGSITLIVFGVSTTLLIRLYKNFRFLKRLKNNLENSSLKNFDHFRQTSFANVNVAFIEQPIVPFTFGWKSPIIVLPLSIQDNPEKIRMAIQHELVHIKRVDYVLQLIL